MIKRLIKYIMYPFARTIKKVDINSEDTSREVFRLKGGYDPDEDEEEESEDDSDSEDDDEEWGTEEPWCYQPKRTGLKGINF